jgi:hypothetical protein
LPCSHRWGANREVPVLHRGRLCPPGGLLGTILPEFFADALPTIRGPSTASSSMRPGPRPTWSAPMAGDREDSACADKRARALANARIPCGLAARPGRRALRPWTDQGRKLQSLIEQFLVATLKPGHIVIMDNLGSHKAMRCAGPFGLSARGFSSAVLQS